MRKGLVLSVMVAAAIVLLMVLGGCSSTKTTTPTTPKTTPSTGSTTTVTMIDFAFQPANLTIKVGTTVKWVNNGAVAHEPAGQGFDTGLIQPGASATHTFTTEGTFPYKCLIHPSVMTGTITVNATGQSSGGTTTPTTPSSNTPLY
jgi:plastocyanin